MKKISLFLLAIPVLLSSCAKQDDTSIGIIGGADGPTTIFLISKFKWFIVALVIMVAVLAVLIIKYIIRKKNK